MVSHIVNLTMTLYRSIKIHHSRYCDCISLLSVSSGLSKLHCLNKLSLDGNQLSSLDASVLDQLPNLSFLSVENNCISSLHGIQRARSLLELYIGNNHISMSQDIYYLKVSGKEITIGFRFLFCCLSSYAPFSCQGMTNLIILDLNGNPLLEKLENYRIYVVFHLPTLKALDGIAVVCTDKGNQSNLSNIVVMMTISTVLYLLLFPLGGN